ncbi:hypothetical protein RND81_07G056100 [Saponaria officinalis]|uniref:Uncharacterized protein n=1 Tax=Saponaria officinalis TaxID=3572 RepID=A0AAW1JKP6_SAPOF
MASFWNKMSSNIIKITNSNNNLIPSEIVHPPNQLFVRACKIGFPFLVLANFALSGYVMAKAKQRDEVKAKRRDEAKTKKRNEAIAKTRDGSDAKQRDEANAKQGLNVST